MLTFKSKDRDLVNIDRGNLDREIVVEVSQLNHYFGQR